MTGCKFNKNFLYSQQFCKCFPPNRKNTRCTPATNAATTPQIPDSQHVTKGHLLGRKRWPLGVRSMAFHYAVCRLSHARRKPRQHAYMKT